MTTKTITTDRPITLHGVCHVPDSFCDGIELCSIQSQKLVPEKSGARLTDTCASFWYQTTGTSFCDVCVAGLRKLVHHKIWFNLSRESCALIIFSTPDEMICAEHLL